MPKLTKQQIRLHEQAIASLRRSPLNFEDREFAYRNLRPDATTDIGKGRAFFTPWDIATDFQVEALNLLGRPKRVLDLCAGFGILSFRQYFHDYAQSVSVTCVEINPEYVAIGKQLFPEAEWILGDVFDAESILAGTSFDEFYSNPPFGVLPPERRKQLPGRCFEYAVAEVGMRLAATGTMIVPQGITDWKYSGRPCFERLENNKYRNWSTVSGLVLSPNCGLDCSHTSFDQTNITVEIVNVDRRDPS